jgi:hypothetical protein
VSNSNFSFSEVRHPDLIFDSNSWSFWRDTFEGGEFYLDRYLRKFSDRETDTDFNNRRDCTPIPTFAKAALLDIRNSIFQRLADVSRIDGSTAYQAAAKGERLGVDRKGSSMNSFIGIDVLTELLLIGRVGIYVDAPNKLPTTMAENTQSPYLYCYRVEDILSFVEETQEEPGQFKAVLLRDHVIAFNTTNDNIRRAGVDLPTGREKRIRMVWKDDDGVVKCKMWNEETNEIVRLEGANDEGIVELGVDFVPFVMPNIGDSVLKDAAWYQRALLNLVSSDVNYALKSNYPFLTIQEELRTAGQHLRKTGAEATPGSQPAQDNTEVMGPGAGRYYDLGTDRPGYIAPPTDPLEASMKLQEKLEDDIRKLVNLAVTNKAGSRTESAEAKKLSSQGLEAGLSYIGTVLRETEQRIAHMWALYENVTSPDIAMVSYPNRYILKEDSERIEDASSLAKLMDRIPGTEVKKVVAKQIVNILLAGKENNDTIESIFAEIMRAGYTTSELNAVLTAHKEGLVGDETASQALGYSPDEIEKAREDRVIRATAILAAQTSPDAPGGIRNAASRGAPELDSDPNSGAKEQEEGREDDGNE